MLKLYHTGCAVFVQLKKVAERTPPLVHFTQVVCAMLPAVVLFLAYIVVPRCFELIISYCKKRTGHLETQRRSILQELKVWCIYSHLCSVCYIDYRNITFQGNSCSLFSVDDGPTHTKVYFYSENITKQVLLRLNTPTCNCPQTQTVCCYTK